MTARIRAKSVRIRPNSFVIGRVEGDLTIPHDGGISGRHAEISRRYENGEHCWYLKDLQSTNGTFVRAATVILSHEQEFLIGSRRFRFELPIAARTACRQSKPRVTRPANGNRFPPAAPASARSAAVARRGFARAMPDRRFPLAASGALAGPRSDSVLDRRR